MTALEEQRRVRWAWRIGAVVATLFVIALSGLFGFIVLPLTRPDAPADGTLGTIARAVGMPTRPPAPPGPMPAAPPSTTRVTWTPDTLALIASGDAQRGQAVAEPCAACHGEAGISADPQFPNLARQDRAALFKQLHDFRGGARVNDVMSPFAQPLSDQDIADLAAFYAAQPGAPLGSVSRFWPARGPIAALVEIGDNVRGIPACTSCHAVGVGAPLGTPALDGQHPEYLEAQLRAYKAGERASDIYGRMRAIAAKLTDAEIASIAGYYASQRPPAAAQAQ